MDIFETTFIQSILDSGDLSYKKQRPHRSSQEPIVVAKTIAALIDPAEDGIKHINIWSRGRTSLGKWLSNFTLAPFNMDGRDFASMEAYWYWLSTGRQHHYLCNLFGPSAKSAGSKLPRVAMDSAEFQSMIARAFVCKLTAHPLQMADLLYSHLPFRHYFVYGNGAQQVIDRTGQHLWQMHLWDHLRIYLRAAVADRPIPTNLNLDYPTRVLLQSINYDVLAKYVANHPRYQDVVHNRGAWAVWEPT